MQIFAEPAKEQKGWLFQRGLRMKMLLFIYTTVFKERCCLAMGGGEVSIRL